jgi:cellulose synthase operon protein C
MLSKIYQTLFLWTFFGGVIGAFAGPLSEAEQLFSSGRGHEALTIYRSLVHEASSAPSLPAASREVYSQALAGVLRACLRFGDHALAEKTIRMAMETFPTNTILLTLAAQYAEYRGRLKEAKALWRKALENAPDSMEVRYRLAELAMVTSVSPERVSPYRWLVEQYSNGPKLTPPDLEWVGRACVRLERYDWEGAQKVYKEALDVSPTLEPVLVAKGDLWLDRYDERTALEIYAEVLKTNKESLPALLGIAQTQREKGDFLGCQKTLDEALKLNPQHPLALAMAADLAFYDQQYGQAEEFLKRGYQTNPIEITLMSVEATYAIRAKQSQRTEDILKRAEQAYANPSEFYYQLADCLERNYLFRDADRFHAKCLEKAPWNKRCLAARAMLASRVSPASAEAALEPMKSAFRSDPFHLRLCNMGNLFAKRAEFAKLESEHFILRIPSSGARTYGSFALDLLEQTLLDLKGKYGYQPDEKVLVEFYEDPDDFSIRIAGLPGTGLAGVCFGDIIIISAPSRSRLTGYSWGNNLRHELTHVISLALSDFRIPRWLTEGLSVVEEWDTNTNSDPVLAMNLRKNELVKLEDMDLAFHRPKSTATVALAYAQSGEVVQALTNHLGFPIHLKLLNEFSKGVSTTECLPKVTGLTFEEINREVKARVAARVALGPPQSALSTSAPSIATASSATESPRNKAWRELAGLAGANKWEQAMETAAKWLESNPTDRPFLEAKCVSAYRSGNRREARKAAGAALEGATDGFTAHCVLGWLERDNRKWDKAVEHLIAAYQLHPRFVTPGSPILQAEEILRDRRNRSKLADLLDLKLSYQTRDAKGYLELAQLRRELGDETAAKEATRKAVLMEPYLPEVQIAWGYALLAETKNQEALDRFRVAADLDTQGGAAHYGMAQAYLAAGSREAALTSAQEAIKLDPALEEVEEFLRKAGEPAAGAGIP